MSKVQKIEKMLYEYFDDNEVHTVSEFTEKAIALKIIDEKDRSSVRNALFKIREYPGITLKGRGLYVVSKRDKNNGGSDCDIEKAFIYLINNLLELKKMDVITNSIEELQAGKKTIDMYKKYMNELSNIINV